MKIFPSLSLAVALFFALPGATAAWAAFHTIPELARELEEVSGKFALISDDSRSQLRNVPITDLSDSALQTAYQTALREMDRAEVFEKISDQAIAISNARGDVIGHIVFPVTFLAIPEGDTDYYVVYYVFVSTEGAMETQFKVFVPLY